MMKISKEFVKQDKCMRKSNIDINNSLKWEEPKQEMFKSAIRLIHKIIKTQKPREIIKKLRLQRSRNCCGIFLRNPPKKNHSRKTWFARVISFITSLLNSKEWKIQKASKNYWRNTTSRLMKRIPKSMKSRKRKKTV